MYNFFLYSVLLASVNVNKAEDQEFNYLQINFNRQKR